MNILHDDNGIDFWLFPKFLKHGFTGAQNELNIASVLLLDNDHLRYKLPQFLAIFLILDRQELTYNKYKYIKMNL